MEIKSINKLDNGSKFDLSQKNLHGIEKVEHTKKIADDIKGVEQFE